MGRRSCLRTFASFALVTALVSGAACTPSTDDAPEDKPAALILEPTTVGALAGWSADAVSAAVPALLRSCDRFAKQPDDRAVGPDGVAGQVADWRAPCAAARRVPAGDDAAAREFFTTWFTPFAAADNDRTDGLFTGYYEPELHGARQPDARYRVPLFRRPPELVMVDLGQFRDDLKGRRIAGQVIDGRLKPYADRAAIDSGALAGRDLELLWVDDPTDAFFLQIQGSGRVVLENGEVVRVGYAGVNGHPYVAVGRVLIRRGAMTKETVSMQAIRAWLADNPDEAADLMAENPSFVFFQEIDGDGPLGAQGVALTPERSLAVDRTFMPLGAPVWLDIADPLDSTRPLRRLVVAQDTGGAIRGPVRGDLFWGFGDAAAERAGVMKSTGRYYLFLPKSVAERRATAS